NYRGPVRVASQGMAHPVQGEAGHEHAGHGASHRHHEHHGHSHDHDHDPAHDHGTGAPKGTGTPTDPHAWQNPLNVVAYVRNISQALSEIDPANARHYGERAEAYV